MTARIALDLDALDFEKGGGLVTVVAVDAGSGAVLMLAHADREALERTLESGEMHYRSRTRGAWHKGATSGNVQRVVALAPDCDGDAVLAVVRQTGAACHTGARSCFGAAALEAGALDALAATIEARALDAERGPGAGEGEPASPTSPTAPAAASSERPSYTRRLLADRNLRLKKIGEEAAELVTACADADAERMRAEAADVLYHVLVALRAEGVTLADVRRELEGRAGR